MNGNSGEGQPFDPKEDSDIMARHPVFGKTNPVAAGRILYINYNPSTLVRDEQLLMQAGYDVDTVFGIDGLMACGSVADHTSISIDEACPRNVRKKLIHWLKANFPKLKILAAA